MVDFEQALIKHGGEREKIKLNIITKTLDALDSSKGDAARSTEKSVDESYQMQKSILSAAYSTKGAIIDHKK